MKLLNFDKVICLSPHPDDVEISMSGTIKKYTDTQFYVYCLTQGTSTDNTSDESRLREIEKFWQLSGVKNLALVDTKIKTFETYNSAQWMTVLDGVIKQFEPDAIFTPPQLDSHQEHRFVNDMVYTAARHNPISIIEYKSASVTNEWTANFYVDINSYVHTKLDNLRESFTSQLDANYFSRECLLDFHTDYQSSKKGVTKSEQFNIKLLYNV